MSKTRTHNNKIWSITREKRIYDLVQASPGQMSSDYAKLLKLSTDTVSTTLCALRKKDLIESVRKPNTKGSIRFLWYLKGTLIREVYEAKAQATESKAMALAKKLDTMFRERGQYQK